MLATPSGALAVAPLDRATSVHATVWTDPHSGLEVAVDGRVDDVAGGTTTGRSAAEVVGTAYLGHGAGFAARLTGEFAAVLLDPRDGTAVALRSPDGSRPLHVGSAAGRVVVASDVPAVLAGTGLAPRPDDDSVGRFLHLRPLDPGRTLLADVARIPAGALATFAAGRPAPARYPWRVSAADLPPDPGATPDGYRATLRRAVADRLVVPVTAVDLSGGLDSTALALLAQELAAGGRGVVTVSARFPGLDADEGPAIDAMRRRLRSRHVDVDVLARDPLAALDERIRELAGPAVDMHRAVIDGVLEAARGEGAGVWLPGYGGDEVLWEDGYLLAAARQLRLGTLAGEIAAVRRTHGVPWGRVLRIAAHELAPPRAHALRQQLRRRPAPGPFQPPWLRVPPPPAGVGVGDRAVGSDGDPLRAGVLRWVTSPETIELVEWASARARAAGVETGFPYLDQRVVRYVASMPLATRRRHGRPKNLQRRAFAADLPQSVREPVRKTVFSSYTWHVAGLLRERWAELTEGEWSSGRWIDRNRLVDSLHHLRPGGRVAAIEAAYFWRALTVELWMRQLDRHRSDARRRGQEGS